jgi:hypothetical protein
MFVPIESRTKMKNMHSCETFGTITELNFISTMCQQFTFLKDKFMEFGLKNGFCHFSVFWRTTDAVHSHPHLNPPLLPGRYIFMSA